MYALLVIVFCMRPSLGHEIKAAACGIGCMSEDSVFCCRNFNCIRHGANMRHGANAQHVCLVVSPRQLHDESINWLNWWLLLLSSVAIEPRRSRGACRSMPIDALKLVDLCRCSASSC